MATKQGLDVIATVTKRLKELNIFDRQLEKVKIISLENGKCTAEYTVADEHTNILKTMHGGYSATLVDCISTYALMSYGKRKPGISIGMNISYLKAAKLGEEIIIEAKTVRAGNNLAFLNILIKNKNTANIILTATHTKYVD